MSEKDELLDTVESLLKMIDDSVGDDPFFDLDVEEPIELPDQPQGKLPLGFGVHSDRVQREKNRFERVPTVRFLSLVHDIQSMQKDLEPFLVILALFRESTPKDHPLLRIRDRVLTLGDFRTLHKLHQKMDMLAKEVQVLEDRARGFTDPIFARKKS